MSERPCCGCPLCQIETELLTEFLDTSRQESCRKLLASAPELAAFPSLAPLLAHLRLCRDTASSDGILRALLQAKRTFDDGSAERIVLLAFLPHMHAAVRSVLRRYRSSRPKFLAVKAAVASCNGIRIVENENGSFKANIMLPKV
jgi:hypothetical protein